MRQGRRKHELEAGLMSSALLVTRWLKPRDNECHRVPRDTDSGGGVLGVRI